MFVLSFALLSLAACTGDGGALPPADDSFTLPSGGNKSLPPAAKRVRGVLTFDDIEGGCAYLETADGSKYEVIYPSGWVVDKTSAVLRGPDGVEAQAGATVTVEGTVATDRSSICQVGPIFQATTVEVGPG